MISARTAHRRRRTLRLTLGAALWSVCAAATGSPVGAASTTGTEGPVPARPAISVHLVADGRAGHRPHTSGRSHRRRRPNLAYKANHGFLGPHSEWRRVVTSAPTDPDSAALVAGLAQQVSSRYGGVAAFNWYQYDVADYTVRHEVRRVTFHWDNCQHRSYVPKELFDPAFGAHFVDVPVPHAAMSAAGTDGALSIWDPSTDQLWEFWKAHHEADGWHACWGGRIDAFSKSRGYFPDGMGVSASGLALAPGSIGIREMQHGKIEHAVALSVVDAANWSLASYPAQRSDGNLPVGTPDAVREGQRLRLDPDLDVDSLGLTPIARAIARAAQVYGFIVTDRAGAVGVDAENGAGVTAASGSNPWIPMLAGVPGYQIMTNFPWNRLQALPVDYGKPRARD